MKFKYLYVPEYQYDQTDKVFTFYIMKPILHYSEDDGKTWTKVPIEDYPDKTEEAKRAKKTKDKLYEQRNSTKH